jgi:hypothetical protein
MCKNSTCIPCSWNINKAHGAGEFKNTLQSVGGFLNILKFHTRRGVGNSRMYVYNINKGKIEFLYYIYTILGGEALNSKTKAKLRSVNIPDHWNINGTIAIKEIVDTTSRRPAGRGGPN